MDKKGEFDELLKKIVIIVFFIVAAFGVYKLLNYLTTQ